MLVYGYICPSGTLLVMKIGILLHVYHLETDGWQQLVWGDPETDSLGTGTKLVECLLDTPTSDEVNVIVYSGPSMRDGMGEGAYTKQLILDGIDHLNDFPRLRTKLATLTDAEHARLVERVQNITLGPSIKNTAAEMQHAAAYFAQHKVDRVLQIAAATHAARCLRDQASARFHGLIDKHQQWFTVASDINYVGYTPDDVVIAEPIHRKDNPLYGFHPAWSEVTKHYPHLTLENKKKVLLQIDQLMSEALAAQPEATEVVN